MTYIKGRVFIVFSLLLILSMSMTACDYLEDEEVVDPDFYSLTVEMEGEGVISVEEGPMIDAGETPVEIEYEDATAITLKAYPADDWQHVGWSGDLEYYDDADNEATVFVDEDSYVEAIFEKDDDHLKIENIEDLPKRNVEYGTEFVDLDLPAEVEVELEDGSREELGVDWQQGDYDGEEAGTYIIEGDLDLTEGIENPDGLYPTIEVTVQEEDVQLYTVTVNYDESRGEVSGAGYYEEGEEVELTAEAEEGYEFVEWTGHMESSETEIAFDMPGEDVELTAVFEEEDLDIVDIEDLPEENVEYGTEFVDLDLPAKVEVELEDGSREELGVDWQQGDYDGEEAGTYTIEGDLDLTEGIENPDGLYPTIQVTVQEEDVQLYTVTVNYDESRGEVSGAGYYEEGEEVELTAEAEEGYEFVEWTGHMESSETEIAFDMPGEDVELTAVFEEEDLDIVDIEDLPKRNVEYGTEFVDLDLPAEVEVELEDGSREELGVDWQQGDYDGEEAGTYTIEGDLDLTEGIENPDGLYPTIEVTVQEEEPDYAYIFGEVTDEDTGEAIESVEVILGDRSTETEADGSYEMGEIEVGTYNMSLQRKDYYDEQDEIELSEGDNELNFELEHKTGDLEAKVLDEDGEPLEEAEVSLLEEGEETVAEETTDDEGSFEMLDIRVGEYTLIIDKDTYDREERIIEVEEGLNEEEYQLGALLGELTGVVTDTETGEGIEGVTVELGERTVSTEADGSYEIRDKHAGEYELTADHDKYESKFMDDIEIEEGLNSRDIELTRKTGFVSGEVTDIDTGDYLEGVEIEFTAVDSSDEDTVISEDPGWGTDSYETDDLRVGEYEVAAEKENYYLYEDTFTLEEGSNDLDMALEHEKGDLEGTVTDEDGNPLTEVQIEVDGPETETTETSFYGNYQFDDLRAGEYEVTVEKGNYSTEVEEQSVDVDRTIIIETDETTEEDFTLYSPAEFEVEIIDHQPEIVVTEELTVEAEVKNTGGQEGTTDIELYFDGHLVDSDGAEINPDYSTAEITELSYETEADDYEEYSSNNIEVEVEDDSDDDNLEVIGAGQVGISGDDYIEVDGDSVTKTYSVDIDEDITGVPVTLESDDRNVNVENTTRETDFNGESDFEVTFESGEHGEVDLTASIEEGDYGVGESDSDRINVEYETRSEPYLDVFITEDPGDEIAVNETIEVVAEVENFGERPAELTYLQLMLDTWVLDESDEQEISGGGSITESFEYTGETDHLGEKTMSVSSLYTWEAYDYNESAEDDFDVEVIGAENVENIEGPETIDTDGEEKSADYTIELDEEIEDVPVRLTTEPNIFEDNTISKTQYTNSSGETTFHNITFSEEMDETVEIEAEIEEGDYGVASYDSESLYVDVDTTPYSGDLTVIPQDSYGIPEDEMRMRVAEADTDILVDTKFTETGEFNWDLELGEYEFEVYKTNNDNPYYDGDEYWGSGEVEISYDNQEKEKEFTRKNPYVDEYGSYANDRLRADQIVVNVYNPAGETQNLLISVEVLDPEHEEDLVKEADMSHVDEFKEFALAVDEEGDLYEVDIVIYCLEEEEPVDSTHTFIYYQ